MNVLVVFLNLSFIFMLPKHMSIRALLSVSVANFSIHFPSSKMFGARILFWRRVYTFCSLIILLLISNRHFTV